MRAIRVAILSTALLSTAIFAGGCAKKAGDIQASYQDPRRFDGYMCHQLRDESQRVVEQVPGVDRADIELVFDPPWSMERISEDARLELGLY